LNATFVERDRSLVFEFEAMASRCAIHIDATDSANAHFAIQSAIDEVKRIEAKYSRYRDESIVSIVNRDAGTGRWIDIDDETAQLFSFADSLFVASDGLFDITSGILRRAWNFRAPRIPKQEEIDALLPLIDWRLLERSSNRVRLSKPGMEIDFGGFGKEYAADRAATVLREAGLAHGFVNLGGDIAVMGARRDSRAWSIGIQDPRNDAATVASIEIASGALATSGDYERFLEIDGKRFCHILNPRTGWPVSHWQSVSVLAPVCTAAGALATIAMLNEQDAIAFLDGEANAFLAIRYDGERFARSDASFRSAKV
jgi:FAD:protein FMN transferase